MHAEQAEQALLKSIDHLIPGHVYHHILVLIQMIFDLAKHVHAVMPAVAEKFAGLQGNMHIRSV